MTIDRILVRVCNLKPEHELKEMILFLKHGNFGDFFLIEGTNFLDRSNKSLLVLLDFILLQRYFIS